MSDVIRNIIGQRVPRPDAYEKAAGAAKYTADIQLPGMLHAKILRSPYAHARVSRIDTSRAEALPGVVKILTRDNTPRVPFTNTEYDVTTYHCLTPSDQVLFDDKARYAGEPVAAVAAVSPAVAEAALELIEVDYESLPAVFDPEEAMSSGAPLVHDTVAHNVCAHIPMVKGNVDQGFGEAAQIIEQRFRTSKQKHAQTEPWSCVADYDATGRLTVWTPSQTPHPVRIKLAKLFAIPSNQVRVVSPAIGGAFGGRVGFVGEPWCAALALAARRPVKLEFSRAEDFFGTESRAPVIIDLKIGFKNDGSLTAIQCRSVHNAGPYATQSIDVTGVHGCLITRLYYCPNTRYDGYTVYTNTPLSGAYRGFGGPQAFFALESMMDMIAGKIGMDPIELRSRNHLRNGDIDPWTKLPVTSCGLEECLKKGAEAIGWAEKRGKAKAQNEQIIKRGVGAGCVMWVSGTAKLHDGMIEGSAAWIRLNLAGTFTLTSGSTDLGTGCRTTLAQVAAEVLGVELDDVTVILGDTDITPFDAGAHASRTMFVTGNAVRNAAGELKKQICRVAAQALEVPEDSLEIKGRTVRVMPSAGSGEISLSDLALRAYYQSTELAGYGVAQQTNAPPFGAQFAEVEVNTETGEVRVIKVVAAHDAGRAINPTIVEGQIEGALHHGIGYALTEDLVIDPETGSALNPTYMDYKLLTAADMPEVVPIIVEQPDELGPFGAKGIGEPGMVPTAAAIANAVYDATGVRVTELPLTPERVYRALRGSS